MKVTAPAKSYSIPLRDHKAAVIGLYTLVKDLSAAQTMLPEILQMMLFVREKLPTMLPVVGEWRLCLLGAAAVFCNYSAAALEALVVVSQCNEILLRVALAFTNGLALYLSTMLRLNAFLRLTLAGALSSPEELDRHGRSSCSTWPPSRPFRNGSRSPLCCGGGRTAKWFKWVQSALHAVPALCRCSLSVCKTISTLTCAALSALCSDFRPSVSTVLTLCGCIRPLLSTLHTVTGYSTQVLGVVWDLSSLMSSP